MYCHYHVFLDQGGREVAVLLLWYDAGLDNALFHYQIGT